MFNFQWAQQVPGELFALTTSSSFMAKFSKPTVARMHDELHINKCGGLLVRHHDAIVTISKSLVEKALCFCPLSLRHAA
eukprot:3174815-Pleurochrysis_carterae.AAC.1